MKKVLISTLIFMLSVMISCGRNSSKPLGSLGENCYQDGTVDPGYLCNLQLNVCLEDVGKNDNMADDFDAGNAGDMGYAFANLSFIEPVAGYENYFALNIVAVINPKDFAGQPEGASYKEFNINITDFPNTNLSANSIYAVGKTTADHDGLSLISWRKL